MSDEIRMDRDGFLAACGAYGKATDDEWPMRVRKVIEAYEAAKAPATGQPVELLPPKMEQAYRQYPDLDFRIAPADMVRFLEMGVMLKTTYTQPSFVHKFMLQCAMLIRELCAVRQPERETVTLSEAEKLELAEAMKRRASYFKDSDMRAAFEAILERFELRRRG